MFQNCLNSKVFNDDLDSGKTKSTIHNIFMQQIKWPSLKCILHKHFYLLVWKSIQNDEEQCLFYWDSALGCQVYQDSDMQIGGLLTSHSRHNREFTQPRRQRQQERHKFAYLTVKNNRFSRFARAFFIFGHSADVLVLSTTWNDLFCSCEDDVSTWWKMFNFVFLSLKRWF